MRVLLFLLIFFCTPILASEPNKATIARVENYLSNIHTIEAEFIQAAPNGDITSGKFYLQRPGKLRMEYAPPTPVLMVTSGSNIVYYDKELDQISRISLEDTLVGFLARSEVKFDDTVNITSVSKDDDVLRISLIQTKKPKDGSLTLEFSDKPLSLRNMIVKDSAGETTTVSLNNAKFNIALAEDLFIFHDPHFSKKGIKK